jgi:hypothetical protein
MKRWALVTVGLYGFLLLFLTVPVGLVAFYSPSAEDTKMPTFLEVIAESYQQWGYWLWFFVLLAAQALLLLVPVDLSERRPVQRRKLLIPVIVASFLLGNLLLAGLFALLAAGFGDAGSVVVEAPAEFVHQLSQQLPPIRSSLPWFGIGPANALQFFSITTTLGYLLILWLIWGLVFYHYAQNDQPAGLVRRATRWLLRLSILELLVAVPSHVIVRQRNDCCAPFATFWGIVTGLSVMLLAFGPGVFFLFARRCRQLKPRPTPPPNQPVVGP